MTDDVPNQQTDAATHVAAVLKAAFAAVASSPLPAEDQGRWQQRLIAITNLTKHDVARASQQLDRFLREWNDVDGGKEIVQ